MRDRRACHPVSEPGLRGLPVRFGAVPERQLGAPCFVPVAGRKGSKTTPTQARQARDGLSATADQLERASSHCSVQENSEFRFGCLLSFRAHVTKRGATEFALSSISLSSSRRARCAESSRASPRRRSPRSAYKRTLARHPAHGCAELRLECRCLAAPS